jgi:putative chitinase
LALTQQFGASAMIDRDFFMQRVRQTLFHGTLQPRQTKGLALLIDRWEQDHGRQGDRRQLAYILATALHETAATMQPIRERGGSAYLRKNYDVTGSQPARARANGNTQPGDGAHYAGRGYVQLTWKSNYRRVGDLIGVDLAGNPDKAMDPDTAATILICGMEQGWFTGRKLADYFNGSRAEWMQARRIVNGLDQAGLIAGYGRRFFAAMQDASQSVSASAPSRPPSPARKPRRANR